LSRDTLHFTRAVVLCGAIALALACARVARGADALNFPPSDFDILNADNEQLIGHGHYRVDQTPGMLMLHGENRYLNGEFDTEEDKLTTGNDRELPRLISFRHDFFNADGSPSVAARLDIGTGQGVCGKTELGKSESQSEQLKFPADTFAGASVLIPIQDFISHGDRESVLKLHVFNCAPTAKLIAVDAKREPGVQPWAHYPPGDLDKIDIKPNFGFFTVVLQPFIPKLAAWFDPSQDSLLVGAQLQRYYKSTRIILVRKREASISRGAPGEASPPPR
jgi:hypothetical protein